MVVTNTWYYLVFFFLVLFYLFVCFTFTHGSLIAVNVNKL